LKRRALEGFAARGRNFRAGAGEEDAAKFGKLHLNIGFVWKNLVGLLQVRKRFELTRPVHPCSSMTNLGDPNEDPEKFWNR